jgi:hypothetical protein
MFRLVKNIMGAEVENSMTVNGTMVKGEFAKG